MKLNIFKLKRGLLLLIATSFMVVSCKEHDKKKNEEVASNSVEAKAPFSR